MTQIPLTIRHTNKDIPLFFIPELNLLKLLDYEFDRVTERHEELEKDWIKNKRCKCATHEDIINKRLVLCCKHFKKALEEDEICKDANKKIERYSSVSIYRTMVRSCAKR